MSNDLTQFNGGQGYSASAPQEKGEYEAIPPGFYPVEAVAAQVRDNYDRDGLDLDIELKITGAQYNGRRIFKKIRQTGANVKEETKLKQMTNLAYALGYGEGRALQSTGEIANQKFDAKVTVYNGKNYAHDLHPAGSHVKAEAQQPQQAQPQAPPFLPAEERF